MFHCPSCFSEQRHNTLSSSMTAFATREGRCSKGRYLRKIPQKKILGRALLLMQEIRRSPVDVGSLSCYLQCFIYIPDGAGFLPSTVWKVTYVLKFEPSWVRKGSTSHYPHLSESYVGTSGVWWNAQDSVKWSIFWRSLSFLLRPAES